MLKKLITSKSKRIGKDAVWLGLTQTVSILCAGISSFLFARLVTPDTYGDYQYLLSVFGVVGFLGFSGMSKAIIRGVVNKRSEVFGAAVRLVILISPLSILISYLLLNGKSEISTITTIWILFVIYQTASLTKAVYHGEKKFQLESTLSVFGILISFVLVTAYILKFEANPLILMIIAIAGPAIPWINPIIKNLRKKPLDIKNWRKNKDLRYGISLSAIDVLPIMTTHIDKIAVGVFLTSTDLAVYSFALAIPIMIQSLMKTTVLAAVPDMVVAENKSFMYKLVFFGLMIGFLSTLAYWLAADVLFKFLYPQYAVSVPYSRTISLVLLGIPGFMAMTYFQVKGYRRILGTLTFVSSLLMLGLVFVLTQKYGVVGAVWARVISRVVMATLAVSTLLLLLRKKS